MVKFGKLGIGNGQGVVVAVGAGGVGLINGIEVTLNSTGCFVKVTVDTAKEVPG